LEAGTRHAADVVGWPMRFSAALFSWALRICGIVHNALAKSV